MCPEAGYFDLPNYKAFTPADHAAHTSPKGTCSPEDVGANWNSRKGAKMIGKIAHKPHLGQRLKVSRRRKRKEEP